MPRVLTPAQHTAAEFLASVYKTAEEKNRVSVVQSMARWIDPDNANPEWKSMLDSVLSDAVQKSSLSIYGLQAKRDYYKAQIRELMFAVEQEARKWTGAELTRQELRIGQIQLFIQSRLHDVYVAARGVNETLKTYVLPTTTPEEHRDIVDSKRRGGVITTRIERARYMSAVKAARERSKKGSAESKALDHLFYLMVHPRGVELVKAFGKSPGTGWTVAHPTFEETADAIRTLRGDVVSGNTLVWQFPPAIRGGAAELRGAEGKRLDDKALTGFALAWAQTRKTWIESALDTAGNAVLALGLVGGPINVVAEVLDLVLSVMQTAVSIMRDIEQDQAATATAFADESKRLSKGSRPLGTILLGAATVIQALALPATVSAITKSGKRTVQAAERVPTTPPPAAARQTEARALAKDTGEDAAATAGRGITADARKADVSTSGKPTGTQKELTDSRGTSYTIGGGKPDPLEAQRLAKQQRLIASGPRLGSKNAPRLGTTVPELPILPNALNKYSSKDKAAFFRTNRDAYPPHIQQLIDDLPPPKQKMTDVSFERIDKAIRDVHTAEANRMAGFANAPQKPFVNSGRSVGNEGGRFSSVVTDNKVLSLQGQIRGGGIAEFDSVRFAEATIVETKMGIDSRVLKGGPRSREIVEQLEIQMMRQAAFVEDWGKWSVVRWEIWDPDPDMAALVEGIRVTRLPDHLAARIQVVQMV